MNYRSSVFFFSLLLFSLSLSGKDVPPPSNALVTDFAGVLSPGESAALERKLLAYNDSTSTQIAVVLDRSLEGDDLFDYSFRLAEAWGIGRRGKDNGVLLYVAFQERKIIFQTGYGAEGFLPDALAKRIIENVLAPAFRQQRYFEGLDGATDIVMQLGSGEYESEGADEATGGIPVFALLLIFLIIIIVLSSLFGGGGDDGGCFCGGRYDMDPPRRGRRGGGWVIFPGGGMGCGMGGGGGFGGGGFGGFGGGGFGGGGASGGW